MQKKIESEFLAVGNYLEVIKGLRKKMEKEVIPGDAFSETIYMENYLSTSHELEATQKKLLNDISIETLKAYQKAYNLPENLSTPGWEKIELSLRKQSINNELGELDKAPEEEPERDRLYRSERQRELRQQLEEVADKMAEISKIRELYEALGIKREMEIHE